jgi:hypothetical protein
MRSSVMNDAAPPDIRRFEALQVTSIIVGLINQTAAAQDGLMDAAIGDVLMLVITLLVSRRRKNWARWLLLIMFVLGAAYMMWNAAAVFALGYPLLTIAATVLQVVALILLFTNQSSDWLRHQASPV